MEFFNVATTLLLLFMFFLKSNDSNTVFPIVILILENYIQRNKCYHSIWNIFMVLGTKSKNVYCAALKIKFNESRRAEV